MSKPKKTPWDVRAFQIVVFVAVIGAYVLSVRAFVARHPAALRNPWGLRDLLGLTEREMILCFVLLIAIGIFQHVWALGENLLWGTGEADAPAGPEPAYRQYFFRKALLDYRLIARRSYQSNIAVAATVLNATPKSIRLIVLPLLVCTLVTAIPAAVVYLIFAGIHLTAVLTVIAVAAVLALLFRSVEAGLMLWRRIFLACPHCYRKVPLPVHYCPGCGATHRNLVPGSYGTVRRRCRCGTLLPTLFLFGRYRLEKACPYSNCGRPMNVVLDARNLHFPIVGGPSAGKSSYLIGSMVALDERARAGEISLEFRDDETARRFEAAGPQFKGGIPPGKTADLSPTAFRVVLKDGAGRQVLLYVYDPAGELYTGGDTLHSHQYYGYSHGILMLIDPFSIDNFRQRLGARLKSYEEGINPSDEAPQLVYDRMAAALRAHSRNIARQRIAVVLTKTDAIGLRDRLAELEQQGRGSGRGDAAESEAVRQWLLDHGQVNLVNCLKNDFGEVGYFHCSALGRLPDGTTNPFSPQRVLNPLAWLLEKYSFKLAPPGVGKAAA